MRLTKSRPTLTHYAGRGLGGAYGPARVGGSLTGAGILGRAGMGQTLAKNPGDLVATEVTFNANTRTSTNIPIDWPYQVFISAKEKATGLWRATVSTPEISVPNGSGKIMGASFRVPEVAEDMPNGDYDIRAALWARVSDPDGSPMPGGVGLTNWVLLSEMTVPSGFQVVRLALSVTAGLITSVNVA